MKLNLKDTLKGRSLIVSDLRNKFLFSDLVENNNI